MSHSTNWSIAPLPKSFNKTRAQKRIQNNYFNNLASAYISETSAQREFNQKRKHEFREKYRPLSAWLKGTLPR